MRESTKSLFFSFVPLIGWYAGKNMTGVWATLALYNLLLAIIILLTAINERIKEG